MDSERKALQGISWSGISQILRLLINFGITSILARLLQPGDFGLLAMVLVFTNFVIIFQDLGLGAAIVQKKDVTNEQLSSIYILNVICGIFLAIMLSFLAPFIANFYNEPRVSQVLVVLSTTFFISAFGIVQNALLIKELQFKYLAQIEIITSIISGILAICLAYMGYGVWSLVWKQIFSSTFTTILLLKVSHWKPHISLNYAESRTLLKFGLNLVGFNFVNYFSRNLDNLIIGKFLGSSALGIYSLVYQIMLFPLSNVSSVIRKVMFPYLSNIEDNQNKVQITYLATVRYVALLTFPMMTGLAIVAPQFISIFYGSQWEKAVILIQVLSFVGLIQSISTLNDTIYQSKGRTDIQFYFGLICTIIIAASFIIGIRWNLEGLAIAYAFATLITSYPGFLIVFRLIGLNLNLFLSNIKSITIASMIMGVISYFFHLLVTNIYKYNNIVIFLTTIVVGIASYIITLYVIDRPIYMNLYILFNRLKKSSDSS